MSSDLETLAQRYQDAVEADEKKEAILAYDSRFQQAVEDLAARTSQVESLEDEVGSLEAELERLLALNDEMDKEAEKEKAALPTHSHTEEKCNDYYAFLTLRSKALGSFATLEAALQGFTTAEAAKVKGQWVASSAIGTDGEWATEHAALEKLIADVSTAASKVESLLGATADASAEPLRTLLQSIDENRPKAVAAANAESLANKDSAATRAEMEAERKALLTWCRQQKTNLDAMVEPDHAQEFCSSMLANFASMDKNFQVLLDFTSQLPGDEALQRDMLECNEVWLNLQVSAYERMRHALLEVHPKSKLEDEVREFVSFSDEVLDFINKVRELFSNTSDPESDSFVRPVLEEADILLSEYGMHEGLPKQLQDFCGRMDCLRDSYSNLRRAVLSRLTFLTSSVPALTASMRRKEEYVARMRDLKSWVEVKSQGETWGDIHERILSIKELIKQEQMSLNNTK